MKHCTRMIAALLAVLLLCSCSSNPTETAPRETETEASTAPIPIDTPKNSYHRDNIHGASVLLGVCPSSDGTGFYIPSIRKFYNIAEEAAFPMCPRSGCSHTDESCPSNISGMQYFLEANQQWYAFCGDGTSIWLLQIDPGTGKRNTLHRWEGVIGETYYNFGDCFYAGGRIFVTLYHVEKLMTTVFQCIDLERGTLTEIAKNDLQGSGEFLGAYGDYVFLSWYGLSEPLLDMEAYLQAHPGKTEIDYYSYIDQFQKEHTKRQILRYDLNTMESTDIYPVLRIGKEESPSFTLTGSHSAFGKYLLYSLGFNTICLYDMGSNKAQEILTAEKLSGAQLRDGRLLYWTYKDEILDIRLRDLDTGEELLIENEGNKDIHAFAIHYETATAFIGLYDGKSAWIAKEDYYAQRYDQVVYYAK